MKPSPITAPIANACPAGGTHTAGTSGAWVGRCTKCGQPC